MPRNAWTRERLTQYIGQEEGYQLEFKSSRPLSETTRGKVDTFLDDLSHHVSAFLNCEGGVLVVGIEEASSSDNRHAEKAVELSPGIPRSRFTPSRLASAVCDRIHPAVASYVQVHSVNLIPYRR